MRAQARPPRRRRGHPGVPPPENWSGNRPQYLHQLVYTLPLWLHARAHSRGADKVHIGGSDDLATAKASGRLAQLVAA